MSTTACPECGLPRADDQLETVPCPICATVAGQTPALAAVTRKPDTDPTAGLPADASQLHSHGGPPANFPFGAVLVFLLGSAAGVGSLLGWQTAFPPRSAIPSDSTVTPVEVSKVERPLPALPPKQIAIAPFPHEPKYAEPEPDPEPVPVPDPKAIPQPQADRIVVIELNLPDAVYTLPFTMKKGERVVLKGKVKTLRASGLDGGAVLDASALHAANIYVTGRIDGRSSLKLNAPNGVVTVSATVTGKSTVEVAAPGGEVKFSAPTTATRPGSQIDGGAAVTLTARTIDLRGDVNGIDTKVSVNMPRTGTLRVAAIRGTATVEYRVPEGKGVLDVSAVILAPTATFKKAD